MNNHSATRTPSVVTGVETSAFASVSALRIRALTHADVQRVTRELNPQRNSETHRNRLRLQDEDRAAYLIAWLAGKPIAHGLVIWGGPIGSPKQHIPVPCPYIEDLWVQDAHRSKGVGSALVACMESLAQLRGHDLIGLSVGIDNRGGQRFYGRLGYEPLPLPKYELSGVLQTVAGEFSFWSEICQYMRKQLVDAKHRSES